MLLLNDDALHVGNQDEDPQGSEAAHQHQELGGRVGLDLGRHPKDPDEADDEDKDVENVDSQSSSKNPPPLPRRQSLDKKVSTEIDL